MLKRKSKRLDNRYRLPILFTIAVPALALFLCIGVTILNETIYFVNAQQGNITKTGIFNYTQTDTSGNSDWINTGNWSLTESPTVVLTFDAVINMTKPDGSESHEHAVSDLSIPYAPIITETNSTIIRGTTTLTMNDGLFFSKVPTTITLSEKNISVYFDPSKIGTHFGNQSIAGFMT
ncbi:hypothetical protein [Candidatus Nitrosocosmicus franklandus]|uniref:Uncharacterized protein n=1 Tax=Candidatus Nitrosocosmicus franklandianus TaxID=1798806 RepID=A0A484ID13_9ARCH|nr:hypothetical protein [Candidatus Nitrosocosmicus franklandus]VFJ13560.1 conserved protein of unknown function [Candidatus Nitrosocosmicus franklandus]